MRRRCSEVSAVSAATVMLRTRVVSAGPVWLRFAARLGLFAALTYLEGSSFCLIES